MISREVSEAVARSTILNDFSGWTCVVSGEDHCKYSLPLDPDLRMDATIYPEGQVDRPSFSLCTRGPVEISLRDPIIEFKRSGDSTILDITQKDGHNHLEFDCGEFDADPYIEGLKSLSVIRRHTFDPDVPAVSIASEIRTDYGNIVKLEESILRNDFSAKEMNGLRITDKIRVRALKGMIRASFNDEDRIIYVRPSYANIIISGHPDRRSIPFSNRISIMNGSHSDGLSIDIDPGHCNDLI